MTFFTLFPYFYKHLPWAELKQRVPGELVKLFFRFSQSAIFFQLSLYRKHLSVYSKKLKGNIPTTSAKNTRLRLGLLYREEKEGGEVFFFICGWQSVRS